MVAVNVVLLVVIFLSPAPIPCLAFTDSTNSNGSKEPTARAPWNATWVDSLKRSLLVGYDKFARPSHHQLATNVSLGLSVYHVELDDMTSVMTIHGWIKLAWNDDKLKWNSSDYGDLDTLHVADHEIWQPDIVQYNSASGNTVDQFGNTHCIVFKNGSVLWVPPAKLTAFCRMDLKHWPQDEQSCFFVFGSWTYDTLQIYIDKGDLYETDTNNDFYVEGSEWELIEVSNKRYEKFYDCCPDAPYVSIEYLVNVKRLGGGAIRATLFRTPVVVSVLLSILSHCLPPTTSRLPLAAVSPTLLSIGLLYFAHKLPSSHTTPNIVIYYCTSLYMACLSGIITVIVINMSLSRRALPWFLRRLLYSRAAKCLKLPQLVEHSTGEELQNTIGGGSGSGNNEEGARILNDTPSPARDWLALAMAIDRISCIIFILIFISISFVYC